MGQCPLRDLFAVYVGAVARIAVAQHEVVVLNGDFGVIARHLAAGETQVVGFAAADLELPFRDRHDATAEGVGYFESGVGHGGESTGGRKDCKDRLTGA